MSAYLSFLFSFFTIVPNPHSLCPVSPPFHPFRMPMPCNYVLHNPRLATFKQSR